MTMEQLPPKGVKREQAILELGKEEANGELLLQLVNTEKGKCKTAAQKALAQLEYDPAAPLWAKLVKGKWMGSHIMSDACSDCVSEQIAPVILKTLSHLLDEADTKPLNQEQVEQFRFCIALMLGKASPKMLEVYRFLAENTERIAKLEHTPCTVSWRKTRSGLPNLNTPLFMTVTIALAGGSPMDFSFGMPTPRKWRKLPPWY